MKNFLRDIQRESDEFRESAMRIEELQRSLTTEYRELALTANSTIIAGEKTKLARETATIKSNRSTLIRGDRSARTTQDFRLSKNSPTKTGKKGLLVTQSTDVFRSEKTPKKKKDNFDIDSIPDPKVKNNKRNIPTLPEKLSDM